MKHRNYHFVVIVVGMISAFPCCISGKRLSASVQKLQHESEGRSKDSKASILDPEDRRLQDSNKPAAPNVYQVTLGYNVALGRTPHEQYVADTTRPRLFHLDPKPSSPDGKPYLEYDGVTISGVSQCEHSSTSTEVYWTTGSKQIEEQSASASFGFDQSLDVSIGDGLFSKLPQAPG